MTFVFSHPKRRNVWLDLLAFCALWSALTAFAMAYGIYYWGDFFDKRGLILIALSAIAAFITAPIAWGIESLIGKKRSMTSRFSAIFVLLGGGTVGATAAAASLYKLPYFYEFIVEFPDYHVATSFAFYLAAGGYSFAASAMRFFVPMGPVALVAISIFYCTIISKGLRIG